ncbi:NYN domain-containing protein [Microcella humidisoli]|uniref:NYN domain-containing protein n=1 Tax=Microcella humidisoli TaxID=2963406 RepID=A0ABY5FUN5_9MICO|nr:NYN domain-containing protein [Microcella humidisoli]UTT61849.1 NYN domain-containing protein [Microcella humidisoli]
MAESAENRVAVYIDFDNIVISRYDQVHGRSAWRKDNVYKLAPGLADASPEQKDKVRHATVDISAILDFASAFGTIVLSRAYADWSVGVNATYQGQLMERAVDLTQLFPATQQMKNGADIRLSVDVVEDLFRLPDITHVVIAAGDSDYIALAQRAKRLGRYIVGIGVAGGTSKSLAAACNEYADYDSLPGIRPAAHIAAALVVAPDAVSTDETAPPAKRSRRASTAGAIADTASGAEPLAGQTAATAASVESATSKRAATALIVRALRLVHEADDADWAHASALKQQMKRLDPAFNEKALGYSSFTSFLKSRANIVELDESTQTRLVRLRE